MLERIAASLPSLAPAEQRVAQLVLDDPAAFARLPVRTLAELARVSKPTVVRFCRSMGYDGLADLKLKLVGSVSEGVPFVHRSVDVDDKAGDVLVKVVDNSVAAFLEYRNAAAPKALEAAAQAILQTWRQHQRIVFFGAGNSGMVADDAQHKFFRLGLTSMSCSDGHVQLMNAALLRRGDCAVVISNSGLTRDLIAAAELARQAGATTIAITASNSPLAKACASIWRPITRRATTCTARWFRACCTCSSLMCWPPVWRCKLAPACSKTQKSLSSCCAASAMSSS